MAQFLFILTHQEAKANKGFWKGSHGSLVALETFHKYSGEAWTGSSWAYTFNESGHVGEIYEQLPIINVIQWTKENGGKSLWWKKEHLRYSKISFYEDHKVDGLSQLFASLVILDEMAVMAHTRLCEWLKTSQKWRTHVMCRTSLYSLLSEHKHK